MIANQASHGWDGNARQHQATSQGPHSPPAHQASRVLVLLQKGKWHGVASVHVIDSHGGQQLEDKHLVGWHDPAPPFSFFQERLYGGKLNGTAGPALGRGDGLRLWPPAKKDAERNPLAVWNVCVFTTRPSEHKVTQGLTHSPTQWAPRFQGKLYLPITYKQMINIKTQ